MEKYECKGLRSQRVDADEYLVLPAGSAPCLEGSPRAALAEASYKLYDSTRYFSALIETVCALPIKANNSISRMVLAFGDIVDNARLDQFRFGQVLIKLRRHKGEAMKGVREREVTVLARATDPLLAQTELKA